MSDSILALIDSTTMRMMNPRTGAMSSQRAICRVRAADMASAKSQAMNAVSRKPSVRFIPPLYHVGSD